MDSFDLVVEGGCPVEDYRYIPVSARVPTPSDEAPIASIGTDDTNNRPLLSLLVEMVA